MVKGTGIGSSDVDADVASSRGDQAVDSLGMPIRMHYQLFALFAVVMGGVPLLLSFTPLADAVSNIWLFRLVCVCPFFLAWFYLAAGKHVNWEVDYRIYHVAGFGAVTLLMAAALLLPPELVSVLVALMLIVPVTAAYVAPFRQSLVHAVTAAVLIIALAFIASPHLPLLRVVTLEIVMLTGYFMVVTTKSHLVAALNRHRAQSTIDSLTGAANVRSMRETLDSEIARAERGGDGFSLISFDLDDFKSSNDRYSHATGDMVLRSVAAAAQSQIEEKDTLARRGGDEFSIIVPAVPGQSIDELCSRISVAIARARFGVCPDILPTASIGWADHRSGENADELLARVDQEVHLAKERSREQDLSFLGISDNPAAGPLAAIETPDDTVEPEDPAAMATLFAWRQAALLFVIVAIAFSVVAATGLTPLGFSWQGTVASVLAILLAPVAWSMSNRKQVSMPLTHVLAMVSLGLITVVGLIEVDAASQTADLFLVAAYFVMFLVPTRQAAGYATAAVGLMAATLILGGDGDWLLRTAFALISVVLVSVILAMSRHRTIEATAASTRLARVDPLTGLPNVRRLRERINSEIGRSTASGRGFSLIMLDLDDFKRVNDRYGHSHGDEVLVAVAGALEANVRQSEMPARRGGDEFAVVLTDTDPSSGEGAVRRFSRAIEAARQELCLDVLSTASIGYADWHEGDDVAELMKRADAALHDSKVSSHLNRGVAVVEPGVQQFG